LTRIIGLTDLAQRQILRRREPARNRVQQVAGRRLCVRFNVIHNEERHARQCCVQEQHAVAAARRWTQHHD
jgi:hypothetical protein